jgi:protein-L-isoaspartate O-methyltransferase
MRGTDGYGSNAKRLAKQYESITFEDVHGDILHHFPVEPSHILDIGAGSGRDAAALAAHGHSVIAVEPTAELRREGQMLQGRASIEWIDDSLPDLTRVSARKQRFATILLTAVWMHLDQPERSAAMPRLAGLLAPGGKLVMTLRHGPVPSGRRMFEVSARETIELAKSAGLCCIHQSERGDMFARADVNWDVLVLQSPALENMGPA